MGIQTKLSEGLNCTLCGLAIEGKIPIEKLPLSFAGFGNSFNAAIALQCKSCGAFLCKDCYTTELNKLSKLKKLLGFNCPTCGSKFSFEICAYPEDLDLEAVVNGPRNCQGPQGPIEAEEVENVKCEQCGQVIDGKILVEPLNAQQAKQFRQHPFCCRLQLMTRQLVVQDQGHVYLQIWMT